MNVSSRDLLIAWAALPWLTPNRVRLLLEYFDPVTAAREAAIDVLEALLRIDRQQAVELRDPPRRECTAITLLDAEYSALLREIIDPPLALAFRGDAALLQQPAIAVVGSRRASPYAINVARSLSGQLTEAGLVVVSGLARGVDAAAHEAALDAGGKTIAVLGTGIDVVYPPGNARLARRIEREGLVVTEFGEGTPPKPEHFPVRNRVISGLALGTIIVEATSRSGSLITARMAAEQGREVFAVPGSIFARGSEGTHRLIQYGAKLVHDVDDVLDELQGGFRRSARLPEEPADAPLRELLSAFSRDEATHVDALATQLGKPAAALAESLLQLELGGWLRALPGARWVRSK